jgi:hypothetical protein
MLRCSCVHFRHPFELGGIYFFVNALMNVASWFVAAALYSLYFSGDRTEPVAPDDASMAYNSTFIICMAGNSTSCSGKRPPLLSTRPFGRLALSPT